MGTLRTRMFLSLMPFVVLLLATGIYAIVLFSRQASLVETIVTGNHQRMLVAQAMRLDLAAMEREAWLAANGTGGVNQAFFRQKERFEERLSALTNHTLLPGEAEPSETLTTNYGPFLGLVDQLTLDDKPEVRREIHQLEIGPRVLGMDTALERIRDLNGEAVLAAGQGIQRITTHVTRLMVLGMGVALLITIVACYRLSRSILEPIQSLTQATRKLGEGRKLVPLPIARRDELGELALAFNSMAAQLEEYRQSTTEQIVRLHRTMESTLASFPDPIFVLDRNGRIELKNPAAAELAAGLGLRDTLPERLQTIAESALSRGEDFLPHSFESAVSHRMNGVEKFFLPRVLAMRDRRGGLFGVAVVLYDVTRFRLLDAAKTNLVATVSHELKTPLTGVRMSLHLLLEKTVGTFSPQQEELLRAASEDAERLLRILNDLLDLARLDEGITELRRERVAPEELLRSVTDLLGEEAAASGLQLTTTAGPGLPPVFVDRHRIAHVFANLVRNAIKHSPPEGEIRLMATHDGESTVEFSVLDRGAGIPEEFHARVFDRFFRIPGQAHAGAGLGLSIAREITVAHGGRIWVKSSPGQGTIFHVALPIGSNAAPGESSGTGAGWQATPG